MDYTSESQKAEVLSLMKEKPIIIFFHMSSCGHCARTMPHWKKLVQDKSRFGLNDVKMVSVERSAIPDEANVNGFPHFYIVNKKGRKSSVDGEKNSEESLAADLLKSFKLGGRRTRRRHSRRLVRRVRKTRH